VSSVSSVVNSRFPENVRDQVALFDDLRRHAEKMMKTGADADEAERRYIAPARLEKYRIRSWGLTVGAALRSYFERLSC